MKQTSPAVPNLEEIKIANDNFWRNLLRLNEELHAVSQQTKKALLDLKQQMEAVEALWFDLLKQMPKNYKAIAKEENQLITLKEQALHLVVPDFAMTSEAAAMPMGRFTVLKREFLINLHGTLYQGKELSQLHREAGEFLCDHYLSDLDALFEECPLPATRNFSHFIEAAKQHQLITKKKPGVFRFDKRRAFMLFHHEKMKTVMTHMQSVEQVFVALMRTKLKSSTLIRFNPMVTHKKAETCEKEFNQYCFEELTTYEQHLRFLENEYAWAENQKPFSLVSGLYVTTLNAIQAWQYELLTQQLAVLAQIAHYLANRTEDLNEWFLQLTQGGQLNQFLVKEFRDTLLQSIAAKNDVLSTLVQKIQQKVKDNAPNKLDQVDSLQANLLPRLHNTSKRLKQLKASPLGIIEGIQFYTVSESRAQENQEAWQQELLQGHAIPDAQFTQIMLRIKKEDPTSLLNQEDSCHTLTQQVAYQLKEKMAVLPKVRSYLQQVIKIILASQNARLIDELKHVLSSLPPTLKHHPIIQQSLQQIGSTLSERLSELEQLEALTQKEADEISKKMTRWEKLSTTLGQHLTQLMHYVQQKSVFSLDQLHKEKAKEIHFLQDFLPPKGIFFNVMEVLDDLIYLSERAYILAEYQKTRAQLLECKKQNKFVSETLLPLPAAETLLAAHFHSSLSLTR